MTDDLHTPTNAGPDPAAGDESADNPFAGASAAGAPGTEPLGPSTPTTEQSPPFAPRSWDGATSAPAAARPELMIAAAFAGGLVFAQILKRLGR
jgi:hypothetical protein